MVRSSIKITDVDKETVRYPKSVAYIISNEFCERFNFYGMRTILVLYLTNKLHYTEESSTVIFHMFTMMVYLFPLVGAIVADSWLGKYKTILYLSFIYTIGCILMALSAISFLPLTAKVLTIIGLVLIAIGTGGIKPCVSAFGGDQFVLPKQAMELAKFFSLFYFAINAGSMISTTLTPILRADVHCFGSNDCFSLAFGVPALLMVLSLVIFVSGKKLYRMKPPSGNMIFGVVQCVYKAFGGWRANRKKNPQSEFLDYAMGNVEHKVLHDTKALFKILLLYLPFPVFWALFDQQGSRWTFQATRMDGTVLPWLQIKPDQMQVVNPLLILLFIPLFDYVVYPLLSIIGIKRPLQKLTVGGLLAAFAFVLSALVELRLEDVELAPLTATTAQLRFYNGMPCRYEFMATTDESAAAAGIIERDMVSTLPSGFLEPLSMWSDLSLYVDEPKRYSFIAKSNDKNCSSISGDIQLRPGQATSYFIADEQLHVFSDESTKPKLGDSLVRPLFNIPLNEGPIELLSDKTDLSANFTGRNVSQLASVAQGSNSIVINGVPAAKFETRSGGVYAVMVHGSSEEGYKYKLVDVIPANSISMLWQLPQIIVITAAEIMFSVTGLEFSFTQAPSTMKSVLQACWLLSVAIGNMLVVVIAELKFFDSQSKEFLLFALLMVVDIFVFALLAMRYTYVHENTASKREQGGEDVNADNFGKGDNKGNNLAGIGNGNGSSSDVTTDITRSADDDVRSAHTQQVPVSTVTAADSPITRMRTNGNSSDSSGVVNKAFEHSESVP